jgi:hypothetical protein
MSPLNEDTMMLVNIIRLAVGVATLALLSSIPAAAQAPKLSPQQLNPPALNVNKPIAAPIKPITVPNALTAVSPNGNKQIAAPGAYSSNLNTSIAAPRASGTIALVPDRNVKRASPSYRMEQQYVTYGPKSHAKSPHASDGDPNLAGYGGILQSYPTSSDTSSSGPTSSGWPPCPGGKSPDPYGNC